MTRADSTQPLATPGEHTTITVLQREIIAAMRAGRKLSQSHKEGGTTLGWEQDRFVIEDDGAWASRQEFVDESAFLNALWKRYDWMASPGHGAQRRSELEAWRFILHELCRTRFTPLPPATPFRLHPRSVRAVAALVVLVLALVIFGVVRLLQVRTIPAPFGQSVRVGDTLATLMRTQERYLPRLHRNPERDRFRIDLLLTPLTDGAKPRMIVLTRDLQHNAFHPGTKILGIDGPLLWMLVPELKALDLRSSRIITLRDLRGANPALEDVWNSARFHFGDRLHLMSADRRRSYTVDPETLRAQLEEEPPRITWRGPEPTADTMLCLGAPVAENAWMFVLSEKERNADFRVGTSVSPDRPLDRPREPRRLYRVESRTEHERLRVDTVSELAPETFTGGALIRAEPGAGALRLESPPGFLLAHRTGTTIEPRTAVTRLDLAGRPIWTVDTGLRAVDQILPDAARPALVGRLPAPEGTLPETVAVVIDTAAGTITTHPLRP